MNSLTRRRNLVPDLGTQNPHELDPVTKRDMLALVYKTILEGMGQPEKFPMLKQVISRMPEHEIDMEWKAITDGTVTKALKVMMSGNMDEEDLRGLAALFDGIAKPYFTQYDGNVPKEDMQWAHNEIKDFFDKVSEKMGQNQLPGNSRRRLLGKVEAKYKISSSGLKFQVFRGQSEEKICEFDAEPTRDAIKSALESKLGVVITEVTKSYASRTGGVHFFYAEDAEGKRYDITDAPR